MPSRKNKNRKAATAPNVPTQFTENDGTSFFPFASYLSVVGVHTTLLAFVSLFLVRTPQALPRSPTALPFLEALTRDPVSTVAWICAGVIPLQGWWAGWVRKWWIEFYMKGTDTEKKLEWNVRDKGKFSALANAWLSTVATSLAVYAVVVLFGAPLLSHNIHTYLLACLISLLTVFTPAYALGIPSFDSRSLVTRMTWTRLFAELSPQTPVERAMVYPAVGVALGSWTGAFPIALDWDRPWQAWPLTPAFGAILGYIAGALGAVVVSAVHSLAGQNVHPSPAKKTKAP